jgi:hypothetical protein
MLNSSFKKCCTQDATASRLGWVEEEGRSGEALGYDDGEPGRYSHGIACMLCWPQYVVPTIACSVTTGHCLVALMHLPTCVPRLPLELSI